MSANKPIPLSIRAVIAFISLPCIFAGLIQFLIVRADQAAGPQSRLAIVPLAIGALILLGAVRDFFVPGRGTLAPWDPPKRLVIAGLYRYVRNPMYLGITVLLFGWSWLAGSKWLLAYTFLLLTGFHLRILLHEEPVLARSFPHDWPAYSRSVRRWIPRFRCEPTWQN